MGQSPLPTTQGANEGSVAPLVSRSSTWYVWKPMLRKAMAVILGGLGLAGIGALSMAQTPTAQGGSLPSSPNLAGVIATEWLATGTATAETSKPPVSAPAPPEPPPCPPPALSPPGEPSGLASPGATNAARLPDGRLILNLATATELTTLPGIGLKRAESIVELRTKLKGFRKLSDLLRIKGIGVKSLKKLEPKLVLNAPAPEANP